MSLPHGLANAAVTDVPEDMDPERYRSWHEYKLRNSAHIRHGLHRGYWEARNDLLAPIRSDYDDPDNFHRSRRKFLIGVLHNQMKADKRRRETHPELADNHYLNKKMPYRRTSATQTEDIRTKLGLPDPVHARTHVFFPRNMYIYKPLDRLVVFTEPNEHIFEDLRRNGNKDFIHTFADLPQSNKRHSRMSRTMQKVSHALRKGSNQFELVKDILALEGYAKWQRENAKMLNDDNLDKRDRERLAGVFNSLNNDSAAFMERAWIDFGYGIGISP